MNALRKEVEHNYTNDRDFYFHARHKDISDDNKQEWVATEIEHYFKMKKLSLGLKSHI